MQSMRSPVNYIAETQGYRTSKNPNHYGVDLGWSSNGGPHHPIFATANGVVIDCGVSSYDGAKYVVTRSETVIKGKYVYCLFWHLHGIDVVKGESVMMGEQLGLMGNTGTASGVHLHLETWVTPLSYNNWNLSDKTKYAIDPHSVICQYADQSCWEKSEGLYKKINKTISDGIMDAEYMAENGNELKLTNEPLYASSIEKKAATTISGTYYKWDNEVINGRIRITNARERIGVNGQITGWIDYAVERKSHIVRSGETLSSIAAAYGLSLNDIIKMNPQIKNPNLIYPNQVVYVS